VGGLEVAGELPFPSLFGFVNRDIFDPNVVIIDSRAGAGRQRPHPINGALLECQTQFAQIHSPDLNVMGAHE
jgi:hypothetical protein